MAKTLRSYIFITFVVCCVSFAILVTSISTTSWISANLSVDDAKYDVNYGLFVGTLTNKYFLTPKSSTIELACIPSENVCAWSCKPTAEERQEDVNNLYYNVEAANADCGTHNSVRSYLGRIRQEWDLTTEVVSSSSTTEMTHYEPDQRFVNLGVWCATCISLVLSIALSGVGAVAAVVNTAANPVHTIAAVPGLYLWNGLAAFFATLAMILWGSLYAAILRENVAVNPTIRGECRGISSLGFSYWIILASILMHLANAGILYFREVMLVRIPEPPTINPIEDDDDRVIIY